MNRLYVNQYTSIEQAASQYNVSANKKTVAVTEKTKSFAEVLKETATQSELKFSKHASERLQSRNIDLSQAQLERLESGARKAGEKGIRESLVLVDDLAFIVNIPSNTVVTAMNDKADTIVTNIDGAVIM
ncbi:MAG: flagellar protein [Lachnospiraceae bacterium]|nr:flagellar protein [Lachnospiraceae bacterium]